MDGQYRFIQTAGNIRQQARQAAQPSSGRLDPPPHVVELVPEAVARENVVLPLSLHADTLAVAAVNPADVMLRDKLSFLLNKRVILLPHSREAIREAIDRLYGRPETESTDSMLAEFTTLSGVPAMRGGFAHPEPLLAKAKHPSRRTRTDTRFIKGFAGVDDDDDDDMDAMLREDTRGPTTGELTLGSDLTTSPTGAGMWFYTVAEGHRVFVTHTSGRSEVVTGPARIWAWGKTFQKVSHYVAHPGEFLIVRFRDGQQEHLPGPAEVWFDPRVHLSVTKQEALQVAAKEAVVVYSREAEGKPVSRRVIHGPTLFVPAPGEWLHTFTWHGSDGGSVGESKVAKGLVFQKLWLMPDQMYHDVPEVRTADDAVLTIKLMIFFELADVERMLDTTHDPIGDFVNAATSDVVDFTGRRSFERFKQETGELNDLAAYRQLAARAAQTGYRITKVVYRGYTAPDRLQAMHDQAIEARTKLELDRATEQQAQELEDFRLNAQLQRAAKRRTEQATEVDAELELTRKRQEAEREQTRRAAELQLEMKRQAEERTRQHLGALKEMGVDLTAFLTQGRADRVIELRGGGANGAHIHLNRADEG
jgi:hypothetical protein